MHAHLRYSRLRPLFASKLIMPFSLQAQRAHINYVEGAATILCLLLLAGLRFAFPSAVLGFAYIVGREFYAWGYSKLGAKGRLVGALIVDFALVALFVMAIMTGWQMANVSKRLGL